MKLLLTLSLLCCLNVLTYAESIYEALENDSNFSRFVELANADELVQVLLRKRRVTVFAPTDDVFARSRQFTPEDLKRLPTCHVVNMVVTKDIFPGSVYPISQENAPLYFNIKESFEGDEKEYFVNNAKIVEERDFTVADGKQKLYVIDEVLEPYRSTEYHPHDAWEFLKNPSLYNIKEELRLRNGITHRTREGRESFYQSWKSHLFYTMKNDREWFNFFKYSSEMVSRIEQEKEENLFTKVGNHTYFIPVDQENGPDGSKFRRIDKAVIKGHIIPQHVLFTRTAGSEAYISSNSQVEIKLFNQTTSSTNVQTMYVRSNTLQDSQDHEKGVVLSRIVRANIPLKNGVVHLIQDPLMIIDTNIEEFIQSESNGKLSEYMKLVQEALPEFQQELQSERKKTVFAPTNEAILRLAPEKLANLKKNKTELTKLLRLHMVMKSVSTDDVWQGRIYDVITADKQRNMYFRAVGDRKNKTLTLEAGGVNATAVEADIGATNGIVHVIDRMLGLPYQTVMEKLSSEPYLRQTFEMGRYDDWNLKLNNRNKRFTFFAPSQRAWDDLKNEMPTEYKQMSMDLYSYHVQKILDRHLIVGKEISAQELEAKDNIQMVRGVINVKRGLGTAVLSVEWEGIQAVIIRPDVQATNGVIHVIDRILMKRRDMMRTGGASSNSPSILASLLIVVLALLFRL
ncbi:fasciclin-1-like [Limulus polyphemus]|uniref:Fasciclin-1-like n=1 Tax=Limulus polyphemus TaxID=6850 RepID=A0ABM1TSB8_LIMPO|nr:fasciclin-1-like [Limulus polyphemus]